MLVIWVIKYFNKINEISLKADFCQVFVVPKGVKAKIVNPNQGRKLGIPLPKGAGGFGRKGFRYQNLSKNPLNPTFLR